MNATRSRYRNLRHETRISTTMTVFSTAATRWVLPCALNGNGSSSTV